MNNLSRDFLVGALFGIVLATGLYSLIEVASKRSALAKEQQSAAMILQPDGPTYPAQFTLPNGQKALTNSGPSSSVNIGGTLISLGTKMSTTQTWTGAYPGEIFLCGVGSTTASATTMAALRGIGIAVGTNQVQLGVENGGAGLLSSTDTINIGCSPWN